VLSMPVADHLTPLLKPVEITILVDELPDDARVEEPWLGGGGPRVSHREPPLTVLVDPLARLELSRAAERPRRVRRGSLRCPSLERITHLLLKLDHQVPVSKLGLHLVQVSVGELPQLPFDGRDQSAGAQSVQEMLTVPRILEAGADQAQASRWSSEPSWVGCDRSILGLELGLGFAGLALCPWLRFAKNQSCVLVPATRSGVLFSL
jgi:hypothetical protein